MKLGMGSKSMENPEMTEPQEAETKKGGDPEVNTSAAPSLKLKSPTVGFKISFPKKDMDLYERLTSKEVAGSKFSAYIREVLRAGLDALDNPRPVLVSRETSASVPAAAGWSDWDDAADGM